MYFSQFPVLGTTQDAGTVYVTDILRRAKIKAIVAQNTSAYDMYDIIDGETPEMVANKFYRDSRLHWVILHTNEILDPRFGWILSNTQLIDFVKNKYGANNAFAVHHYKIANTDVRTDSWPVSFNTNDVVNYQYLQGLNEDMVPVTNYEYESELNEQKRRIKILQSKFVPDIIAEFGREINK